MGIRSLLFTTSKSKEYERQPLTLSQLYCLCTPHNLSDIQSPEKSRCLISYCIIRLLSPTLLPLLLSFRIWGRSHMVVLSSCAKPHIHPLNSDTPHF